MTGAADDFYSVRGYGRRHPGWHEEDAEGKSVDLIRFVLQAAGADGSIDGVIDVGCGTGAVLAHLSRLAGERGLDVRRLTGVDPSDVTPSPLASTGGIEFVRGVASDVTDHHDLGLLVDVLEHLDDPRATLRHVGTICDHLIVRQPLLASVGTYRHDQYRLQRETLGHINVWNHRSFLDLMASCDWEPVSIQIVAPWELTGAKRAPTFVHRALVRLHRQHASVLISGFYLNGLFQRRPARSILAES